MPSKSAKAKKGLLSQGWKHLGFTPYICKLFRLSSSIRHMCRDMLFTGVMVCGLLILAACAPAAPIDLPEATATLGSAGTPLPQPTIDASPTPFPSVPAQPTMDLTSAPEVTAAAHAALAAHLNVAEDTLTLVSTTAQEWSDGSLGCPDPSLGYTQAIVPGYFLVFSDGVQDYAIHTSTTGMPLILCQNGMPEILPEP